MQQFERFLSDDTPHGGGHWQQSYELGEHDRLPVEGSITWAIQKVRRAGGSRAGGYPGAAA